MKHLWILGLVCGLSIFNSVNVSACLLGPLADLAPLPDRSNPALMRFKQLAAQNHFRTMDGDDPVRGSAIAMATTFMQLMNEQWWQRDAPEVKEAREREIGQRVADKFDSVIQSYQRPVKLKDFVREISTTLNGYFGPQDPGRWMMTASYPDRRGLKPYEFKQDNNFAFIKLSGNADLPERFAILLEYWPRVGELVYYDPQEPNQIRHTTFQWTSRHPQGEFPRLDSFFYRGAGFQEFGRIIEVTHLRGLFGQRHEERVGTDYPDTNYDW